MLISLTIFSSYGIDGVFDLRSTPCIQLVRCGDSFKWMSLSFTTLHRGETSLERRTKLVEQFDQTVTQMIWTRGLWIERVFGRLIDKETTRASCQVVLLFFKCHYVQIHQIPVKLTMSWRWIPA